MSDSTFCIGDKVLVSGLEGKVSSLGVNIVGVNIVQVDFGDNKYYYYYSEVKHAEIYSKELIIKAVTSFHGACNLNVFLLKDKFSKIDVMYLFGIYVYQELLYLENQ